MKKKKSKKKKHKEDESGCGGHGWNISFYPCSSGAAAGSATGLRNIPRNETATTGGLTTKERHYTTVYTRMLR